MVKFFAKSKRVTRKENIIEREIILARDYSHAKETMELFLTERVLEEYPEFNYFNLMNIHGLASNFIDLDLVNKMFSFEVIFLDDIIRGSYADIVKEDALWLLYNAFR